MPVARYATFGTPALAESVVDALENRTAVLMANHGAVTVGADAEAALELSLLLEWAATVYLTRGRAGHAAGARRGAAWRGDRGRPGARVRVDQGGRGRRVRAIAMGVHVTDVLARPVEEIPAGQGGALVEEIRITAAGSAGGTALTLAKLGAEVSSAGAIGTDALGDVLIRLLEAGGVDPSLLVRRDGRADVGKRAADPPERRPPRTARRRRQRHLRARRRSLGRDRAGHPPAPGGARVHGRRGRRPRSSPSLAGTA